jgi:hypothetical protein
MVAERRQSSRIKAEAPGKRRLSEIEAEKPTPLRKRQKTPTKVDQPAEPTGVLPAKISDGKPLPSLKKPQSLDLLDSEYQSVLERYVDFRSHSVSTWVLIMVQWSTTCLLYTVTSNMDTWHLTREILDKNKDTKRKEDERDDRGGKGGSQGCQRASHDQSWRSYNHNRTTRV